MAYIIKNDLIFNNLVMYTNVLLKIISNRAANNGRSTDNVRSKIGFVWANP